MRDKALVGVAIAVVIALAVGLGIALVSRNRTTDASAGASGGGTTAPSLTAGQRFVRDVGPLLITEGTMVGTPISAAIADGKVTPSDLVQVADGMCNDLHSGAYNQNNGFVVMATFAEHPTVWAGNGDVRTVYGGMSLSDGEKFTSAAILNICPAESHFIPFGVPST
jgi:hypothetical protein